MFEELGATEIESRDPEGGASPRLLAALVLASRSVALP